jgi:hypothetical protein
MVQNVTEASDGSGHLRKDKESLRSVRARWWREEELVHQRLTWLLAAHTLLGGAYAWLRYRIAEVTLEACKDTTKKCESDILRNTEALPAALPPPYGGYVENLQDLMHLLGLVGGFVSLFALAGLTAAWMAQNRLHEEFYYYDLGVSKRTTNLGRICALSLPLACIFLWFYIETTGYRRALGIGSVLLLAIAVGVYSCQLSKLATLLARIRRGSPAQPQPGANPLQTIYERCQADPETHENKTLMQLARTINEGRRDFDEVDVLALGEEALGLLDALIEKQSDLKYLDRIAMHRIW